MFTKERLYRAADINAQSKRKDETIELSILIVDRKESTPNNKDNGDIRVE